MRNIRSNWLSIVHERSIIRGRRKNLHPLCSSELNINQLLLPWALGRVSPELNINQLLL
jgi:hypothetical protein